MLDRWFRSGDARRFSRPKVLLVSDMTGVESDRLVKILSVPASCVGRQLHQAAAFASAFFNGPTEHLPPYAGPTPARGHANGFDLTSPRPLMCEAGDETELEHAHDPSVQFGDREKLILIGLERLKGREIGRGGRMSRIFAVASERIVGKQPDKCR